MFQTTAASTSLTPLRFAAEAPALLVLQPPQRPQIRPSLYQEFAAHQLLHHLTSLAANWDGYGACPIHSDTVLNAHRTLSELLLTVPVPEIVPNPNATVSFEWESPLGHANLEIGLTRFSFYLKLSTGPTIPLDGAVTAVSSSLGSVISALLFPAAGAQLTAMTSIAK